tara:strand:- start:509 stop:1129 length:621 start_codon:yes stop_codon:yes gene_type:complete
LIPNTSFDLENQLLADGFNMVGGLDEVGRGALAGPVAAGLVVFPRDVDESLLLEVTDSKKLSQKSRERLSNVIHTQSLVCEVGYADASEIDQLGIVPATKLAMDRAIDKSVLKLDYLIVDALDMSETGIPFYSLYKADQISKTVAAASIIAKVHRDHYMQSLSRKVPGYFFEKNKGYGTKEHMISISNMGPSVEHRKTFSPVSKIK